MGNRLKEKADFKYFEYLRGFVKPADLIITGLTILIVLFCTTEGVQGSLAETLRVRVESGRVRETPVFDAPVEFGIKKGDIVPIIRQAEDWYLIKIADGRTGWAHQSLFDDPNISPEPPVSEFPDAQGKETEPVVVTDPEKPLVKEVRDIQVKFTPDGDEKVIFVMSGFYSPEIFALEDAIPKVVCDFTDVRLGEKIKKRQIDADGKFIKKIRIGIHEGEKTRVVLDLSPSQDYDVEQLFLREENLYILTFKSSHQMPDASDEAVVDKKYGF